MSDRKISLQITDMDNHVERFESLRAFRSFCETESSFWEDAQKKLGNQAPSQPYLNIASSFRHLLSQLQSWESSLESWDAVDLNNQLNWAIQNFIGNAQSSWLWHGQPYIHAYIKCFAEHGATSAQAFIEYVVRKNTGNINNAEWFKGYMFGYEFLNQKSEILQRRKSEKISLDKLRGQFVEARNQLFGEAEAVREEICNWDKAHKARSNRRFSAQKRLNKAVVRHNEERFAKSLSHMSDELGTWQHKVAELETLYQEKLKLQKPADYWAKAAKRYGLQGSLWALAIVAAIVVGLVYFREFFVTWLQGKQMPLQLNSLQGVVLFGSIAAVYAFLLKTLSRLAFSAFHLMRDAEEREQLTYLYLSLSNESAVDEKSREIVLQALFSRSETGLLTNESGPTMPGIELAKAAVGKG